MGAVAHEEFPEYDPTNRWGLRTPQVRRALKFIKSRPFITVNELVEWDQQWPLSQRLFTWDDVRAGEQWRLHEARLFLNRFRAKLENGMRARGIIHIHPDENSGIEIDGYVLAENISQNDAMRFQVIADITKRMKKLASELKIWKLTEVEREALIAELWRTLEGQ